jgi:1,4-alpha-glucan branching enzyme
VPPVTVPQEEVEALVRGDHPDPFKVLGVHSVSVEGGQAEVIRVLAPNAEQAWVVLPAGGAVRPMTRLHPDGLFEYRAAQREDLNGYRIRTRDANAATQEFSDPYSFPPLLTDYDLHLLSEGRHWQLYEKLGAHPWRWQDVDGVLFAVWAPNAARVSVVGDFNGWDGRRHPMRPRGGSGVWELFLPELAPGTTYKYEIKSRLQGGTQLKSDPLALASEVRPRTASVVCDLGRYQWNDDEWMEQRARRDQLSQPMTIYEAHLGSWKRNHEEGDRFLNYRELAEQLVPYVRDLGFTHLELLPVMEHPLDESWGYQVTGFYAATSRHGTPDDFRYFVDTCHQQGLGLLLDWVPAHFPRDGHALACFDGSHLYEHADPRLGEHRDWGTLIFNYGRNEVRNFLLSNALFWLDKYHVDGLRVDAVASMLYLDYSRAPGDWIPNQYGGRENLAAVEFLHRFNQLTHGQFPGSATVAEESTSWPAVSRPVHLGGLGFTYKWNMGWMHDTLSYFSQDPLYRKYHHQDLTFSLLYAFHENFVLPLSHDEVVHGKASLVNRMPGDEWRQFANLRLLLGYQYTHPGKKLLFMGGEFGQRNEWNSNAALDWWVLEYAPHQGVQKYVRTLNWLLRSQPALYEVDFDYRGFEWIDFGDYETGTISYLRRARDPSDFVVCVLNLTPLPRFNYRIGVPEAGLYRELLNSDSEHFWGSNMGNHGGVQAEPVAWHGRPYSLSLTLPPLAILVLKP